MAMSRLCPPNQPRASSWITRTTFTTSPGKVVEPCVAALLGCSTAPEERRPIFQLDMATLHLAIYDAVNAAPPAAQEAAVHAAGVTVLKTLLPQRAAQYQATYDAALAALPAGPASDQGLAIGTERAARVLSSRANDGRWAEVAPAVPGTAPGAFRDINPINQTLLWMTHADATSACFETKYHYYRWRSLSVITRTDPAWKPRLPTPNHP